MKVAQLIIIDGYNLMWTSDTLNPIARHNFSKAKDKLVESVLKYSQSAGEKVILVFDGYKGSSPYTRREDMGPVEIVITAKGINADNWIMDAISREPFEGFIVTSDLEIIRFAESKGVKVVKSRKFESGLRY